MAPRIIYDGLVLTGIDVQPVEGTDSTRGSADPSRARRQPTTPPRSLKTSGKSTTRITRMVSACSRRRLYQLRWFDVEGGDGKPLFCVHGFNTQPGWRTHGGSEQLNEGRSSTRANSRSCLLFDQMKEDLRITCVITARTPQELARPSRRSSVMLTPFPESRCFATLWHGKLCSQTCCSWKA